MFTGLVIIIFTIAILACDRYKQERCYIKQDELLIFIVGFNMIGWILIIIRELNINLFI